MKLYDKLSLIYLSVAEGTLGVQACIKPGGENAADFNFSRSSEATTRNELGKIVTIEDNIARLNFSNFGCPRTLLEQSSENLVPFSNVVGLENVLVNNEVSSPYTLNNDVDGISMIVTDGRYVKLIDLELVVGETYTLSFYVDEIDVEEAYKDERFIDSNVTDGLSVKLSDLKVGRNEFTFMATEVNTSFDIGFGAGTAHNMTGSIKFGGLQLENRDFATSLIPTNGNAKTRETEYMGGAGNTSTFNSEQGTIIVDFRALKNGGSSRDIELINLDGSFLRLSLSETEDTITAEIIDQGNVKETANFVVGDQTLSNKVALRYSDSGLDVSVSGIFKSFTGDWSKTNGYNALTTRNFEGEIGIIYTSKLLLEDDELEKLTTYINYEEMRNSLNLKQL